jgi:hypothetical protein
MVSDDSPILDVSEEYADSALVMVYDFHGRKYPARKYGQYIHLDGADRPAKGTFLTAVMEQDTAKTVKAAECENAGGGYYQVLGLRSRRSGIDGVYHTAPADIIEIGKIIDAAGNEYEAKELRTDLFRIEPLMPETEGEGGENPEPVDIAEPLRVEEVKYVPPFLFALSSQNLSKEDAEILIEC